MVALYRFKQGKTEVTSKPANQYLIIIKYVITCLLIFIMVILKWLNPLQQGERGIKLLFAFLKVVNEIKNHTYLLHREIFLREILAIH